MNAQLVSEITALCSGPMPLPGWCSVEKALHIANVIIKEQPRVCVEIGVFGGRSFAPMALALDSIGGDRMAYGIDAWSNAAALDGMDLHDADERKNADYWSKMSMAQIFWKISEYLEQRKLFHCCALIQARSEQVAPLFPLHRTVDQTGTTGAAMFNADAIDLLHIDGNHTELASCRDVRLWIPRVKSGGWVFLDDVDWASLQPALKLMAKDCELIETRQGLGSKYQLWRKR